MGIWKKKYQFWAFILPVLIPFILFFVLPLLINIYYSLIDWNGISSTRNFVGLSNYLSIFQDRIFKKAFSFNLKVMLFNMTIGNMISLGMALIASSALKSKAFARSCFFAPGVLSAIITGYIWQYFFANISQLNLPLFSTNWLASPKTALYAMLLVGAWKGSGNGMIYYYAGIMNIDESYYESAKVDGANKWVMLTRITLPLLMPMITVNLFLTIAGAFNIYDLNYALTNGGPANATTSIAFRVYDLTFGKGAYGQGSAMAIVLTAIVMTFATLQVTLTRRKETRL